MSPATPARAAPLATTIDRTDRSIGGRVVGVTSFDAATGAVLDVVDVLGAAGTLVESGIESLDGGAIEVAGATGSTLGDVVASVGTESGTEVTSERSTEFLDGIPATATPAEMEASVTARKTHNFDDLTPARLAARNVPIAEPQHVCRNDCQRD